MTNLLNTLAVDTTTGANKWAIKIFDALEKFLVPILIILCGVGLIYAVVIGVKMIKADNKEAREENKQRLINIAITIVAVLALIAIFYALKTWIVNDNIVDDAKTWVTANIGQF